MEMAQDDERVRGFLVLRPWLDYRVRVSARRKVPQQMRLMPRGRSGPRRTPYDPACSHMSASFWVCIIR